MRGQQQQQGETVKIGQSRPDIKFLSLDDDHGGIASGAGGVAFVTAF